MVCCLLLNAIVEIDLVVIELGALMQLHVSERILHRKGKQEATLGDQRLLSEYGMLKHTRSQIYWIRRIKDMTCSGFGVYPTALPARRTVTNHFVWSK